MPKVFIIILNWNGWRDTIECLESLKNLDYKNFEIIVVDNGSGDESIQRLEEYRRKPSQTRRKPAPYRKLRFSTGPAGVAKRNEVELRDNAELRSATPVGPTSAHFRVCSNESNLGFAGGNNVGIREALKREAGYILLLNNDTIVDKFFLKELIGAGESDKKIGILGPIVYFFDKPEKIWFAGGRVNWLKTKGTHIDYKKPAEIYSSSDSDYSRRSREVMFSTRSNNKTVDYISGCCLLIKKEVIDQIGFMDEDYFLYYEDTDWCLRAKKAGYQCVLAPSAKIYHKVSQSVAKLPSFNYIYYHTRNGLRMAWRMNGWPKRVVLLFWMSWLLVKQIIKLAVGYKREWARAVIKGVGDFVRGRVGEINPKH